MTNSAIDTYLKLLKKGYHGIIIDELKDNCTMTFREFMSEEIDINERLKKNGYNV